MSGRGRLCFHSAYLFPILAPWIGRFAGGAEVQLAQLMGGLRARDFDVNVVTCDYGQPAHIRLDDIGIYRSYPPQSRVPVIRFFHPRLTRTVRALNAADAEVYYVKGGGFVAGITHDVARWRNAGFVEHVAHDHDVERALTLHPLMRDRWWHRRALRGADRRLTQTEFQRGRLLADFGLESQVLPNLVEIPPHRVNAAQDGVVVWLGTYKASKRPEWFQELARAMPERRFVMTGVVPPPPLTQDQWLDAERAARELPNLEVHGFLEHRAITELFSRAALVVHSSPAEGFSNVLLEAWSYGVPTVSSVDPDGVVRRHGLGSVATDFSALVSEVTRWLDAPAARGEAGARARAYVVEHHAPDRVLDQLTTILDGLVTEVRRKRGTR